MAACPICGDLESIREWISPGENGLLVDPADPVALADALIEGLENKELREKAAANNLEIIRSRAELTAVRLKVGEFYEQVEHNK